MKPGFRMALRVLVGLSVFPAIVVAGEPLVTSALVTRPAMIEGVESWTIETVLPRGAVYRHWQRIPLGRNSSPVAAIRW